MHHITKNGLRVHVELQCKFARWYGKNIPNDNLLEIMIQTVKEKLFSPKEPMQLNQRSESCTHDSNARRN